MVSAYQAFLDKSTPNSSPQASIASKNAPTLVGNAHLEKVKLQANGIDTQHAIITSGQSGITIDVTFASDPSLPCPNIAMALHNEDGRIITSAATWEDQFSIQRASDGSGQICLRLDHLPLLKGAYLINIYLLCDRGLHLFDSAERVAILQVKQTGRLQGYFSIPHQWENHNI